jgi:radical SAM protein with 4Fe4S-binding SPASM domain
MYCPLPFDNFQVKPDGEIYCCCEDWLPYSIGNLLRTPSSAIWNGEIAKAIRASILDQTFEFCTRCPYLPGPAGPVRASTPDGYPHELHVPTVRTLVLNHDRTCNLKCGSCRTSSVDRSGSEASEAKTSSVHHALEESDLLRTSRRIYASGTGDPVASPLYWDLLCHYPLRSTTQIVLHTNGILLTPDRWRELGSNARLVSQIGASVDAATPATYAQLRGGHWDILWQNLRHAASLREPTRPIEMGLYYTVQAANYAELPLLEDLATSIGASWIVIFFIRNWGTYSDREYSERAVHLPQHPEHSRFNRVMHHLLTRPIYVLPHLTLPPSP